MPRIIGRLTLCLFVVLTSSALAEDLLSFRTYDELRQYCLKGHSALTIAEANRALAELRLLHGKVSLGNLTPRQLLSELESKGYFRPPAGCAHDWIFDPLTLKDERFLSLKFGELKREEYSVSVRLPKPLLKRAMLDDLPQVRSFVISYLATQKEIAPVKFVLRAFLREENSELVKGFISLLKAKRYVKASLKLKKVPRSLKIRIHKLVEKARTKEEHAQALFLAVMFTKMRPSINIPLIIYQLDEAYAIAYFVKLFRAYPSSIIEEFTVPFREGYGDKHRELLQIFIRFKENKKILSALKYALEHRNEDHFAEMEFAIIGAWQKMTKIRYEGTIRPYIEWYKTKI